jgi:hypothetical protein
MKWKQGGFNMEKKGDGNRDGFMVEKRRCDGAI